MYKIITIISILLIFQLTLSAQDSFNWQDYLPEQKIDSVVFLSPIKTEPHILTKKESQNMTKTQLRALNRFHQQVRDFHYTVNDPITEYSEYLMIYEIKKSVSNTETIKSVVKLLPKDSCKTVNGDRCIPVYRDCALFYAKGRIVFGLKICFNCLYVRTTPDRQEGRCLGNKEHISEIFNTWDKLGLIDSER